MMSCTYLKRSKCCLRYLMSSRCNSSPTISRAKKASTWIAPAISQSLLPSNSESPPRQTRRLFENCSNYRLLAVAAIFYFLAAMVEFEDLLNLLNHGWGRRWRYSHLDLDRRERAIGICCTSHGDFLTHRQIGNRAYSRR